MFAAFTRPNPTTLLALRLWHVLNRALHQHTQIIRLSANITSVHFEFEAGMMRYSCGHAIWSRLGPVG